MIQFPEVQRKAQAELDIVIGHDRFVNITDRERLPYLNAIVLELYRWIPVAPLGARLPLYDLARVLTDLTQAFHIW